MGLVFVASLTAYKLEGCPISWHAFVARYRLDRMSAHDWLWTLAILVVAASAFFSLSFAGRRLARIPFFAPHPAFPPDRGLDGAANLIVVRGVSG